MTGTSTRSTTPTASSLIDTCERGWSAIQERHPDLPDVVLVLGTGVERGRLVKLGHWWGGRWTADGEVRGEVLLAGEALHLTPAQVFEVLLHEAAHGLNAARGVKDTSRGGRYHNARFRAAAEQLGLVVRQMPPYGWAQTELGAGALAAYEAEIAAIGDAMRIARRLDRDVRGTGHDENTGVEVGGDAGGDGSEGGRGGEAGPAMCGCGRRMRMAPSVLAEGPVLCGLCGGEFSTDRTAERHGLPVGAQVAANLQDQLDRSKDQVAEALRVVAAMAASAEGALLLADVGAWREANRLGDPRPIEVATALDLVDATAAARALLKLERSLHGAAVAVADREFLIGELVAVGEAPGALVDLAGVELPPPGVLGTVVDTDPDGGTFVVDFPIAGTNRLGTDTPAAAALDYGYVEVVAGVGAPLIDLRALPEAMPPSPDELSLMGDPSW